MYDFSSPIRRSNIKNPFNIGSNITEINSLRKKTIVCIFNVDTRNSMNWIFNPVLLEKVSIEADYYRNQNSVRFLLIHQKNTIPIKWGFKGTRTSYAGHSSDH